MTDPKNFPKAPLAPIYTNFEGGARVKKKTQFSGQNVPKSAQNAGFGLLSKICQRRRKFGQIRVFVVICKTSEIPRSAPAVYATGLCLEDATTHASVSNERSVVPRKLMTSKLSKYFVFN